MNEAECFFTLSPEQLEWMQDESYQKVSPENIKIGIHTGQSYTFILLLSYTFNIYKNSVKKFIWFVDLYNI